MNTNANTVTLATITTLARRHEGFRLALVAFAHAAASYNRLRETALNTVYTVKAATSDLFNVNPAYTAAWAAEAVAAKAFEVAANALAEEFDAATGSVDFPEYVNLDADALTTFLECDNDSTPVKLLRAAHRPRNEFALVASLKVQRQETLKDNGIYSRRLSHGGYQIEHPAGEFTSYAATRRLGGATDTSNNDGALGEFFYFQFAVSREEAHREFTPAL